MTDDQCCPAYPNCHEPVPGPLGAEPAGWSANQVDWPAHLRDDAPKQQCDRCRRFTWDTTGFGRECRMTQPNGSPCSGTFGAVPR